MARVVIPGVPHHVTQRGNRRQKTFFSEGDFSLYKALMAEWCAVHRVEVWAYCLMPNHTHLILVPPSETALRAAVGEAHRRYTTMVNATQGWTGCLWQGRFGSYPMGPGHLYNCARYVEGNPVRAGLVASPELWRHSSARAHLAGRDDALVQVAPLLERFGDWHELLRWDLPAEAVEEVRRHARTGRPVGDRRFLRCLEGRTGRRLRPSKGGRPTTRGSRRARRQSAAAPQAQGA
jgi:putative transposase